MPAASVRDGAGRTHAEPDDGANAPQALEHGSPSLHGGAAFRPCLRGHTAPTSLRMHLPAKFLRWPDAAPARRAVRRLLTPAPVLALLLAAPAAHATEVRGVEGVELVPPGGSAFTVSVADDERVEQEFLLRNTWASPQTVRLSAAAVGPDARVDAPGTASWLEVPGEVRLRAGEIRTLRLGVRGDGQDRTGAVVVEVGALRATTLVRVDGTSGMPLPLVTGVFVLCLVLLAGAGVSAARRRRT